jgi:hypothetical protein
MEGPRESSMVMTNGPVKLGPHQEQTFAIAARNARSNSLRSEDATCAAANSTSGAAQSAKAVPGQAAAVSAAARLKMARFRRAPP